MWEQAWADASPERMYSQLLIPGQAVLLLLRLLLLWHLLLQHRLLHPPHPLLHRLLLPQLPQNPQHPKHPLLRVLP